jgi:hypothetical protein
MDGGAEVYQQGEVDIILRDRICARCYGHLLKRDVASNQYEVFCPKCGDEWGGATISKKYAERLGQKALIEYREVKVNLPDLFNDKTGKSETDLLKDLGF